MFRDGTSIAEMWDPVKGEIYQAGEITDSDGMKMISAKLEPFRELFYHLL